MHSPPTETPIVCHLVTEDTPTPVFVSDVGHGMFVTGRRRVATDWRRSNPSETVIAQCTANGDRQAQVDVKRHEDEHQQQSNPQLNEVGGGLNQVTPADDGVSSA